MKNLLIYLNTKKTFAPTDNNDLRMVKTQIDNSLLFWAPEDIFLVTNFPFEYHGIESLIVPNDLFCNIKPKASKINVIIYLLENNLLEDLTWFHDFDAFQLAPIELTLDKDLGLTDYGWRDHWNTGTIFFKPTSLDVFRLIRHRVYRYRFNEELALRSLTKNNEKGINSRYIKLNITYNIGAAYLDIVLPMAEKPLKVAHFAPYKSDIYQEFKPVLTADLIRLIDETYYA